ncbi:MAG: hypothetical protein R6X20_02920 [Phycisphaerae bacterium]
MTKSACAIATAALLLAALALPARGDDAVTPGEVIVQPPTLICLGIEWRVDGDDNGNATAAVTYRKKGAEAWQSSLALYRVGLGRRLEGRELSDGTRHDGWPVPEALVGSVLDLEPGTEYEVRLQMADPDGVRGEAVRTIVCATRPDPQPAPGPRVRHVYPPDWKGPTQEPAYRSIAGAVGGYHPWCDNYNVSYDHARPGDTILVHGGVYRGDRFNYRDPHVFWLWGTQVLSFGGTKEKPIVIKAAGDGEAIIDGAAPKGEHPSPCLFNVMAADYLHVEGLVFRNAFIGIRAGLWRVGGCKGLTVRDCVFANVANGVLGLDGRCRDFTILDNWFIGTNDGDQFHRTAGGAWGRTRSGYAVNLLGSGHAVGYNYAERYWDGINVNTSGHPDPALHMRALCIDIYNNHIHNICDNFIEADGGLYNIRVLRNRCFNSMATPLSYQPIFVGPVYWIRNVVYNAANGAQSFKACGAPVMIAYHNTFTGHWAAYEHTGFGNVRNNAFLGPGEPVHEKDRDRPVLKTGFRDPDSVMDYNAHRVGLEGADKPFVLKLGGDTYAAASLAELGHLSGAEAHGVAVRDFSVLARAGESSWKTDKTRLFTPDEVDLRPAPGGPLVDAGCRTPGINDDYAGKAPDIGAYEAGRPVPHYGPRTERTLAEVLALMSAPTPPPASGRVAAPAGPIAKSVPVTELAVDGSGAISAVTVGGRRIPASSLRVGKASSKNAEGVAAVCNLNVRQGVTSPTQGEWVLEVTDFAEGPRAEVLILEVGGNDGIHVAAILDGRTVGKPLYVPPGAWGRTDVASPVASGNVAGVLLRTADLLGPDGKPLGKGTRVAGIHIVGTANGIDPVCVVAVVR